MTIPREPRQQMINIMYLVLTAMLALNVSAEILNAFKLLRDGMNHSNMSINEKIEGTMKAFDKKVKKEKRGQEFYKAAEDARALSAEFQEYIDGLDATLLEAVGESAEHPGELEKLDDIDTPTRLFVEGVDGAEGLGYELERKVNEYREKFVNLFKTKEDKEAALGRIVMRTDSIPPDSEKPDWTTYTFYNMPAQAVRTLLTKYKTDVVSTESGIVDQLFGKVGEETILYDKFKVAIIPNSTYLLQGETFEAQVYLAASSSMAKPRVTVNGQSLTVDANGMAHYKASASSVGEKSVNASITTKTGTGQTKTYKGDMKYKVATRPDHAPVVSADKMNVFYIGVDNPVSASITGIRSDKTNVSMTGGSISPSGGPGKFVVRVNSPGVAKINLSGKAKDGSPVTGSKEFRVKRIPDPVPELGGKQGGSMGTGEMKAQMGVIAKLKDFDFDARFDVAGFEMTLAERGQDLLTCVNAGAKFSGQCQNLINRAKVGSIYYFDNIRAKGPDGTTRKLPTISFKVK